MAMETFTIIAILYQIKFLVQGDIFAQSVGLLIYTKDTPIVAKFFVALIISSKHTSQNVYLFFVSFIALLKQP